MSRHAVERYNDEFKKLFERQLDAKRRDDGTLHKGAVAETEAEAAELLGVKPETVHAWLRPEGGKTSYACPKFRVDMYKLGLPPDISRISFHTRDALMESLSMLRSSGLMSEPSIKAFDRIARKLRKVA